MESFSGAKSSVYEIFCRSSSAELQLARNLVFDLPTDSHSNSGIVLSQQNASKSFEPLAIGLAAMPILLCRFCPIFEYSDRNLFQWQNLCWRTHISAVGMLLTTKFIKVNSMCSSADDYLPLWLTSNHWNSPLRVRNCPASHWLSVHRLSARLSFSSQMKITAFARRLTHPHHFHLCTPVPNLTKFSTEIDPKQPIKLVHSPSLK
jgi:hypothetical protein